MGEKSLGRHGLRVGAEGEGDACTHRATLMSTALGFMYASRFLSINPGIGTKETKKKANVKVCRKGATESFTRRQHYGQVATS